MNDMKFTQKFVDAAENGDISTLRNYVAESIQIDPLFEDSICEDCMAYLKGKGVDITEPLHKTAIEPLVPQDHSLWKKELFHEKVECLRQNFAYDERIPEIKEIGKEVYGKKSVNSPTAQVEIKKCKVSPFAIAGIVAAIVAVIGLIIWILKK